MDYVKSLMDPGIISMAGVSWQQAVTLMDPGIISTAGVSWQQTVTFVEPGFSLWYKKR